MPSALFMAGVPEQAAAGARPAPEHGAAGPGAPGSARWRAGVAGGLAAAVAVPGALWAGRTVGLLSSHLLGAALPALLLYLLLPPLAVVGAAVAAAPRGALDRGRWRPALGVALALHGGVLGVAIALGASAYNLGDGVLLTLAEVGVLGGAVARTLWPSRPPAA